MKKVVIGGRPVGEGEPAFIIAEIGSNHDGKLEQAKQLIARAKECGADAVKFQTFRAATLVSPRYGNVYQAVKKAELPAAWFRELADEAARQGIVIMSTPFDEESAALLDSSGVPAFKIASYDVTDTPLLRYVAGFKKPVILSTGMATLAEVAVAVDVIRGTGNNKIILLHCVSNYPPRFEDINLKAMVTMHKAFRLPVGFSDHSPRLQAILGAIALGACVIEKHFTLDRNLPGPDHAHSLEPGEFSEMVKQVRQLEAALGDGVKAPVEAELPERQWRRGIYAAVNIPKGTKIKADMLKMVRPCIDAYEPTQINTVVGNIAKRNIAADDPINGNNV